MKPSTYNTAFKITTDNAAYAGMNKALSVLDSAKTAELSTDNEISYQDVVTIVDGQGTQNGQLGDDDFTAILQNAKRFSGDTAQAITLIRAQLSIEATSGQIDGF